MKIIGRDYLNINDITPGSALHTLDPDKNKYNAIIREGISVVSLDNFCDQLKIFPNLIKIDIDGNEDKLLNGAKELLKNKYLRSLMIELDDKKNRDICIKKIEKNGFKLINFFEQNSSYIFSR